MKLFTRISGDKATTIERAYFDADRGCIELALARFADLRIDFPQDPVLEYAEGILRKDFIGQGLQAQQQFLLAQSIDPNHQFSAFNSAKYARNLNEYRRQSQHSRTIAPKDEDLRLFDNIDKILDDNHEYFEHLISTVYAVQEHESFGELAAVIEIALQANDWSRDEELSMRISRANALRQLDKAAETIRQGRNEYYPPQERLALTEAINELDHALELDPYDPKLWNYKSAWLILLRRFDDAYAAGKQAIAIQPKGYLKPLTNMALAEFHRGHIYEAKTLAKNVLKSEFAKAPDAKFDVSLAENILNMCNAHSEPNDETIAFWSEKIFHAASITAEQFKTKWKWKERKFNLVDALKQRCRPYNGEWHMDYIKMTAELLHDFCPELAHKSLLELGDTHQPESLHHIYAALYIASQCDGVMERDACRFVALTILNQPSPEKIRKSYREAVIVPCALDERFSSIADRMRDELSRLHPDFPALIANQSPVKDSDREYAERVTLSRFRKTTKKDTSESFRNESFFDNHHISKHSNSISSNNEKIPNSQGIIALLLLILGPGAILCWKFYGINSPITLALYGLFMVTCLFIWSQRNFRTKECAICKRKFEIGSNTPSYITMPEIMLNRNAFLTGREGVGRRCVQCGKIVCSSCNQQSPCPCGSTSFTGVRLIYKSIYEF